MAPAARVVAVKAKKQDNDTASFCDVQKSADSAPTFLFPAMDETPPAAGGRVRWVNIWATWCGPCVEELALITRLTAERAASGHPIDLSLVSVDVSRDAINAFATKHPEAKSSLRAKDPAAIASWLPAVGLDQGATLPIHLFVDAQGKVRCARTGGVHESDLPRIKKLLEGL